MVVVVVHTGVMCHVHSRFGTTSPLESSKLHVQGPHLPAPPTVSRYCGIEIDPHCGSMFIRSLNCVSRASGINNSTDISATYVRLLAYCGARCPCFNNSIALGKCINVDQTQNSGIFLVHLPHTTRPLLSSTGLL